MLLSMGVVIVIGIRSRVTQAQVYALPVMGVAPAPTRDIRKLLVGFRSSIRAANQLLPSLKFFAMEEILFATRLHAYDGIYNSDRSLS